MEIDPRAQPLLANGPWSAECEEYSVRARRDAKEIVIPVMAAAERDNQFPRSVIEELAKRGHLRERWLIGAPIGDLGRALILPYEMGYCGDTGIALGLTLHHETVTSILAHERPKPGGIDAFEKAIAGELIVCIAMTEPHTGSDYLALETTAVRDGSGYRINGTKKFISLAVTADMALVFTSTGSIGKLSAFLVPRGDGGYRVERKLKKLGTHSLETCVLTLENVWVPEDHLVGELHRGVAMFTHGMTCERLTGCAIALGCLRSSVEIARTYLGERKTRTGVLWDYQALRHRLADLLAEHEVLLKSLRYTAWGAQHGICDARDAAMTKLVTVARVEHALSEALQLLGGVGYIDEFPIERHLRDVRLGRIGGGSDEIMRNLVSAVPLSSDAYEDWMSYRARIDSSD